MVPLSLRTSSAALLFSFVGVFATGCGGGKSEDEVTLVPVTGKVTLNGKAIPSGQVTFHPNASKGNTSKLVPVADITTDGTYTVRMGINGVLRDGAPAGWYTVTVAPTAASESAPGKVPHYNPDNSFEKNSPHVVEVKAGTTSYDIKLKP